MTSATTETGRYAALLFLLMLIAAALRIAGSTGDLWLDEIWSLDLVAGLPTPVAVFYGIAHDNNHLLNSFWLALVGPDAPAWLARLFSIVLGVATVAAAARLGWRSGPLVGVLTAGVFALAYPMVHYGSEARGYAGLVLSTLLAIDAFERSLAGGGARHRLHLGLAVGLGALFHLTMVIPAGILGLVAILRYRREGRTLPAAVGDAMALFRPAVLMLLPALLSLLAGIVVTGGFTVGSTTAFSWSGFASGYGGLLAASLGLPSDVPGAAAIVLAALVAGLLAALDRDMTADRRALVLVGLFAVPGAMAAVGLGNTEFPRYFLFSGVILLVVLADAAGRGLASKGATRAIAALGIAAFLAGHAALLGPFLIHQRGDYRSVVLAMGGDGPATYFSNQSFKNGMIVDFFAAREGLDLTQLELDDGCATRADWYVHGGFGLGDMPARLETRGDCPQTFEFVMRSRYAGLSGWDWVLYRAVR